MGAEDAGAGLLRLAATRRGGSVGAAVRASAGAGVGAGVGAGRRRRRRAHTAAATPPDGRPPPGDGRRIAVVGGGLTGLTTAYYLAKKLPASTRITLFEASDRLGGWIRTDRVAVDVGGVRGTVGFERGPRTLSSLRRSTWRFDDAVLYDLALDLGLAVETPPDRPRYVLYPDHLVAMPPAARIDALLREPLFRDCLWAPAGFLLRLLLRGGRPNVPPPADVSVAEWVRDVCMSRAVADHLASAVVHGVYGGDVDRLSARYVLDRAFWAYYLPRPGAGTRVMRDAERRLLRSGPGRDPLVAGLARCAAGSLLHLGAAGMESLPAALAGALAAAPNVAVRTGSRVRRMRYDGAADRVEITAADCAQPELFDRVIATVASRDVARAGGGDGVLPTLAREHAVSVMTVNLWYPQRGLKPPGFGFLIPRSVPPQLNPERALGVFFDSDVAAAAGPAEPPGTKLFVLLGGHYYDAEAPPSEAQAVAQAHALLERHLGIPRAAPCFALARLARDAIPQPLVGHRDRMAAAAAELRAAFAGRLAVAGGSYTRVGVMGALRAGYEAARLTADGDGDDADGWRATGLEAFERPEHFVDVPVGDIPLRRFDSRAA